MTCLNALEKFNCRSKTRAAELLVPSCVREQRAKHAFKSILCRRNPSSSAHQDLKSAGAVWLLRGLLGSQLPLTLSDFGALENSFQSFEGNAQHL